MLFARFLEQNNLLMYDEHTALTLAECSELAQDWIPPVMSLNAVVKQAGSWPVS